MNTLRRWLFRIGVTAMFVAGVLLCGLASLGWLALFHWLIAH